MPPSRRSDLDLAGSAAVGGNRGAKGAALWIPAGSSPSPQSAASRTPVAGGLSWWPACAVGAPASRRPSEASPRPAASAAAPSATPSPSARKRRCSVAVGAKPALTSVRPSSASPYVRGGKAVCKRTLGRSAPLTTPVAARRARRAPIVVAPARRSWHAGRPSGARTCSSTCPSSDDETAPLPARRWALRGATAGTVGLAPASASDLVEAAATRASVCMPRSSPPRARPSPQS
mmetsp:Transcript_11449/g.33943  ORF Transcript_11449/g.33943 Transcript_11449/m.33943 type:complete len:233 (+) Transcript_11449:102-800(+)